FTIVFQNLNPDYTPIPRLVVLSRKSSFGGLARLPSVGSLTASIPPLKNLLKKLNKIIFCLLRFLKIVIIKDER
ncbi:hypothetical protein KKG24_00280, partial [Patescibacteria group bacterium]|nr:hypothetical protein [Patescibacteria group bacterium]